jgi:NTE family protein
MKNYLSYWRGLLLLFLFITQYAVAAPPPRVALVLGGGGARGLAHLGVLQGLTQAGIPIDLIVGTSAGSIVGALYANNPDAAALTNLMLDTSDKKLIDLSLLHATKGPFVATKMDDFLCQHLSVTQINQLKIKYIAVATNLQTGKTVALVNGPIVLAVQASSALPPFFPPVKWNNDLLVDAGVTDPVPVDVAKMYHPKVIIAVSIAKQLPVYAQPKNIVEVYDRATLINKLRFDELSAQGADVILTPNVAQVGLFDDSHKIQLVDAGRAAVQQAMPQICALLKQNHIKSGCDKLST